MQMSYANTLFSTATQLAVGLGSRSGRLVFVSGKVSEAMGIAGMPGMSFRLAFVAIALICPVGMVDTLRLTKDAGSAVSSKSNAICRAGNAPPGKTESANTAHEGFDLFVPAVLEEALLEALA